MGQVYTFGISKVVAVIQMTIAFQIYWFLICADWYDMCLSGGREATSVVLTYLARMTGILKHVEEDLIWDQSNNLIQASDSVDRFFFSLFVWSGQNNCLQDPT